MYLLFIFMKPMTHKSILASLHKFVNSNDDIEKEMK